MIENILNTLEEDLGFSERDKKALAQAIKSAQEAFLLKGEHRLLVASIYLDLHERILGKGDDGSKKSKLLREMFCDGIGISSAALRTWIDVKETVADHIPKQELVSHSFSVLQETSAKMKRDGVSLKVALAEVTGGETEHKKRIKLLLRYSHELLTSCRKYRGKPNADTAEVLYRLRECTRILKG